jgi:hypothetical protein
LELARFELGLELCRLDAREPDERDDEARLLALEPDPFLRLFVARELELERLVVDEFLVCWGI